MPFTQVESFMARLLHGAVIVVVLMLVFKSISLNLSIDQSYVCVLYLKGLDLKPTCAIEWR